MASIIHLVRHGEVENPDHVVYAALDGFGLSEHGRAEAAETADRLSSLPITNIVASPLQRAQETAAVIADALGLHVTSDSRLTEWALAGRWSGVVWEQLPERFPGELEAYLTHPERLSFSPEPLNDLAGRVAAAASDAAASAEGEVVLVSHQDPIQAGRLSLTGRPLADLPQGKPDHCSVVTLARGEPWHELEYWVPASTDQGAAFPPPATDSP